MCAVYTACTVISTFTTTTIVRIVEDGTGTEAQTVELHQPSLALYTEIVGSAINTIILAGSALVIIRYGLNRLIITHRADRQAG